MSSPVSTWTYRDAVREALADEMRADPSVVLLGEDVAAAGGVFKATDGLLAEFGRQRVWDTPISEQAIVGAAIGAAMLGLKPVAEIMFADFAAVCFDQIANQLAKHSYLTGGQIGLPVTLRLSNGAGSGFAAQHSQPVENWFIGQAGLKVCVPSSPMSVYSHLREAIRDPEPVLIFEPKSMYGLGAEREINIGEVIGQSMIRRHGRHVTVVAIQMGLRSSMEAAERLAQDGIEIELIDPGTLRPLDMGPIIDSVMKTGRLACVEEGEAMGSWAEHVVGRVVREAFHYLDAPPLLVSSPPVPVPYARALEMRWVPNTEDIASRVKELARS